VERNRQKLQEGCNQAFDDRLREFRDECGKVGWSDLKGLERLIKDGEDLKRTPYVSSERADKAAALVRDLEEWLTLAKEQPRLRPEYDVQQPSALPPDANLVAEPSEEDLPLIPEEPPADAPIAFQLADNLAPGEYAVYIHGLDYVSNFASCRRDGQGVSIAVNNGRQECCRFCFTDPRLSGDSQLRCELPYPEDKALLQLQRRLWLSVVELRDADDSSRLISLRRARSYPIAVTASDGEVTLSDLPKDVQTTNLYLADGQLSYGNRSFAFGHTWRKTEPSRQWTIDQLGSYFGLSIAEIRLQSTETEAPKIVTRFEADQNRLAELARKIENQKEELTKLQTLTQNATEAAKKRESGIEIMSLAIALNKKVKDRRPIRDVSDYNGRKVFDRRSSSMREWTRVEKMAALERQVEKDWKMGLGREIEALLSDSRRRQDSLHSDIEEKEQARESLANSDSRASHWTSIRVNIYRIVQAHDRQIRVPLVKVDASRPEH